MITGSAQSDFSPREAFNRLRAIQPMNLPRPKRLMPVISIIVLFLSGNAGWGQAVAGAAENKALQKVIGLQFFVALKDQAMIEGKSALLERVAMANKIYQNTRLRFEIREVLPLPAEIQDLVSRKDRNSLAEKTAAPDRMIQVFVVHSARDVDEPDGWIAGVHWRYGGLLKDHAKRRFIILSSLHSNNETLAHELGHWFGLNHEKDEGNLMCGTVSRNNTLLKEDQIQTLHKNREAALRRKEIELKATP